MIASPTTIYSNYPTKFSPQSKWHKHSPQFIYIVSGISITQSPPPPQNKKEKLTNYILSQPPFPYTFYLKQCSFFTQVLYIKEALFARAYECFPVKRIIQYNNWIIYGSFEACWNFLEPLGCVGRCILCNLWRCIEDTRGASITFIRIFLVSYG